LTRTSSAEQWVRILQQVRKALPEQAFNTWFRNLEVVSLEPGKTVLGVPNRFVKEWLRTKYLGLLRDKIVDVTGFEPEIKFSISGAMFRKARAEALDADEPPAVATAVESPAAVRAEAPVSSASSAPSAPSASRRQALNPEFRLENFVVGASNRLAHAASMGVVESPAATYNPLYIYGAPGLGKSHLLQGICRRLSELRPEMNVLYTTCERFTNDFTTSLAQRRSEAFRGRYRGADCLLIEDLQFLAGKDATQEEFFHTFDSLYNLGRQIVVSGDAHPSEISRLKNKLAGRLASGLAAEIKPPLFATRVEIIRSKALRRGLAVSDEVAGLLAGEAAWSVREMEGAVTKLAAMALHDGRPVDADLAREVLGFSSRRRSTATLETVASAVADEFGVAFSAMKGAGRSRNVLLPRQAAMFLGREMTGASLAEVGAFFGGRDHATVIHAARKIARLAQSDPDLKGRLEALRRRIGN